MCFWCFLNLFCSSLKMFSLHKVSIEFKYKWGKKIEMEKARENVQTVFNIIFIVWDFHCVLLGAAVCFFLYLHSLQSFSPFSVLSCSAAEVSFKKGSKSGAILFHLQEAGEQSFCRTVPSFI